MLISDETIFSRQNPIVKWAASLNDKKGRKESGCFLAHGKKLAEEAAKNAMPVEMIFVAESAKDKLLPKIKTLFCGNKYDSAKVYFLGDDAFAKITSENSPEGVICAIKYLDFFERTDIIYKEDFLCRSKGRQFALFSVRDPGNLGAVMRSCAAFGVDTLVLSDDCADPYNPKCVRASMGALFKLRFVSVGNFGSYITAIRQTGRNVYAAELTDRSVSLVSVPLSSSDVVIVGNEGHGILPEISALCTKSLYIPIAANTESLNASVAASIFLWELAKVGE